MAFAAIVTEFDCTSLVIINWLKLAYIRIRIAKNQNKFHDM